jgi:hypothetical protein
MVFLIWLTTLSATRSNPDNGKEAAGGFVWFSTDDLVACGIVTCRSGYFLFGLTICLTRCQVAVWYYQFSSTKVEHCEHSVNLRNSENGVAGARYRVRGGTILLPSRLSFKCGQGRGLPQDGRWQHQVFPKELNVETASDGGPEALI